LEKSTIREQILYIKGLKWSTIDPFFFSDERERDAAAAAAAAGCL
jgi:hypothetical protein